MPKTTPTNCPRAYIQSLPPASCGRRSTWRLARSAVIVVAVGTVIVAGAFIFFPKQQTAQAILCTSCSAHVPEPGPARPWEVDIPVSTYSRVNTRNGNLFTAIPIVSWSGVGPDMNMMLYHNSANVGVTDTYATATGLTVGKRPCTPPCNTGSGWSISYSDHLLFNDPYTITVVAADGTKDVFTQNGANWDAPLGVHDRLEPTPAPGHPDLWRLTHKNQSYHEFEKIPPTPPGATVARLNRVVDATGNAMMLTYGDGVLVHLEDASGRRLVFNTDPVFLPGLLGGIQDPEEGSNEPYGCTLTPRNWVFYYEAGRLEHISDARGHENTFIYYPYPDGRLDAVSDKHDPSGTPDWHQYGYGAGGQVSWVSGGLVQHFTYSCVSCPPPYGPDIRTLYTQYIDRRGSQWIYTYDDWYEYAFVPTATLGEIASLLNGQRTFAYDEGFNLVQYCEPSAADSTACWNATYDANGNWLTSRDPLSISNEQTWTYDPYGHNTVTSHTDGAGNITRLYYDDTSHATLLTRIVEPCDLGQPPEGQLPGQEDGFPVTRLTYYLTAGDSGFGKIKDITDPNGVWTGFEYDQWGQQATYSEGRVNQNSGAVYYSTTTADSGGRVVQASHSCGGGQTASSGAGATMTYNTANQPTGSECSGIGVGAGAPSSPVGSGIPPVPCPTYAPAPAQIWGDFSDATYSPKGELTSLPMTINRGLSASYTRTHTAEFDALGRQTMSKVVSDETGSDIPREFNYTHNWGTGTYTRTGPDGPDGEGGAVTTTQLDAANRVVWVERRASADGALLMRAEYTYFDNDLVRTVTYSNGGSTWYTYDAARRVTQIKHKGAGTPPPVLLQLDYSYYNDLPVEIFESGSTVGVGITISTTFVYDRLRRLKEEQRCRGITSCDLLYYDLEYLYDAGGNRIKKIDYSNGGEVDYTYDVSNKWLYGSNNNRLMKAVTLDADGATLSTTWYYYKDSAGNDYCGNVHRIVSDPSSGGGMQPQYMMAGGGGTESGTAVSAVDEFPVDGVTTESPVDGDGLDGGGGMSMLTGGGAGCPTGSNKYTATRFEYAKNGATVTYVMGESWCWNEVSTQTCPYTDPTTNYQVLWAREFRYDGARARYMNRKLGADLFTDLGTTWSDYDGDEAYGDFTVSTANPPVVSNTDAYQPGLWNRIGGTSNYLHNDLLGTLRLTTGTTGTAGASRVFTAFGERLPGSATDRFGYVGAWGYQDTLDSGGAEVFPYLHVGHRYYDPSSGRFLQRDPIGIRGGVNVYAYAFGTPPRMVDAEGLIALGDTMQDVGNAGMILGGVFVSCGFVLEATGVGAPAGAAAQLGGAASFIAGAATWILGKIINIFW
jgi:RHS repeat-associated protein